MLERRSWFRAGWMCLLAVCMALSIPGSVQAAAVIPPVKPIDTQQDEATGSISGFVYEADGTTPISGANVTAVNLAQTICYIAFSTSNGSYTIQGVPSGSYRVYAQANGYIREYYINTYVYNQAAIINVTAPDNTANINFMMEQGGSISGHVYQADGVTPVSGAKVTVNAIGEEWASLPIFSTAADGSYLITGIPTGNYRLKAEASGYIIEYYDGTYSYNEATPVSVTAPNNTPNININLNVSGSISGYVYQNDGTTPISGATVGAMSLGLNFWRSTTTTADGSYTITGLMQNNFKVSTDAAGYVNEYYNNTGNPNQATPVVVTPPNDTPNINFTLDPSGSISGHVYQADGVTPLSEAFIQARLADGTYGAGMSNADGSYSITGAPSGDNLVIAQYSGYVYKYYDNVYNSSQASLVRVNIAQNTSNIDFSLEPGGLISGYVYGIDGTIPVSGVTISATDQTNRTWQTSSSSNGSYTTPYLPAGDYTLKAEAASYLTEYFDGAVTANDATPVTVQISSTVSGVNFSLVPGNILSFSNQFQPPICAESDIIDITCAANGTTGYMLTGTDGVEPPLVGSQSGIWKTVDGGKSWSAVAGNVPGAPTNMTVAPDVSDGSLVAVIAGNKVYFSNDGGNAFAELATFDTFNTMRSIAISPQIGDSRSIAIAGDEVVYFITFTGGFSGASWTNIFSGNVNPGQVLAVKFSPNYLQDRTLVATSTDGVNTRLNLFNTATQLWNADYAAYGMPDKGIVIQNATATHADIDMPGTYMALEASSRITYLGLNPGGLFRNSDKLTSIPMNSVAINDAGDRLIAGPVTGNQVYAIPSPATATSGEVHVSSKSPSWATAGLMAVDFLGTSIGAGTSGPESAFALSTDSGNSFNDTAFVDTTPITTDFIVNTDGTKMYIVTENENVISLWRKTTSWERVFKTAGTGYIIRAARDNFDTIFLVDKGSTAFYFSNDAGQSTWQPRIAYATISDFAAESASVQYTLTGTSVSKTTDGGYLWDNPKTTTGAGAGDFIEILVNGNLLVTGTDGIAYSTNGATNWTPINITIPSGHRVLAAASGLTTGDYIYASSTAATNIFRWKIGTSTTWTPMWETSETQIGKPSGMSICGNALYLATDDDTHSYLYRTIMPDTANSTTHWSTFGPLTDSISPGASPSSPYILRFINQPKSLFTTDNGGNPQIWALSIDTPASRYLLESATDINIGAPTDISLSGNSIAENQPAGTTIGSLSTADPEPGDTFSYTKATGTGSDDNALFTIDGNIIKSNAIFNYETKSAYIIKVRSTDSKGLYYEKSLTISVINIVETPAEIILSNNSIAENQPVNTIIGTLSTIDPDTGDTFTYNLVNGTGDTDNSQFNISGSSLRTSAVFDYETRNSYNIRVRSTDHGGLFLEKQIIIVVNDLAENTNQPPTDISLSNYSVDENQIVNTMVGSFTTTDPDVGDIFSYTLAAGEGDTDNSQFNISGSSLRTSAVFEYETRSSYNIRVRSTDSNGLYYEKSFIITVSPDGQGGNGGNPGTGFGGGFSGGGGGAPTGPGITNLALYTNSEGLFVLDGKARSEDGCVNIDFAKGVLAQARDKAQLKSVKIISIDSPAVLPSGFRFAGKVYELTPDGATFTPGITLTLTYDEGQIPEGTDFNSLGIMAYNPTTATWEVLPSTLDKGKSSVTATIGHFSIYAVAGREAAPPPTTQVYIPMPANFSTAEITVNPATVTAGQTVTISTRVSNTGETDGKFSVTLKINGVAETTKEISVKAGSSEAATFTVNRDEPGTYEVEINGQKASFTIKEPAPATTTLVVPVGPPPNPKGTNWWLIGLIAAGIIIVSGAGIILWLNRKTRGETG